MESHLQFNALHNQKKLIFFWLCNLLTNNDRLCNNCFIVEANAFYFLSGHSSVVERNLAKVDAARSNRVARLIAISHSVNYSPHRLEA